MGQTTVILNPDDEHDIPYRFQDDALPTFEEELKVAADTAEGLVSLGADLAEDTEELKQSKKLLREAIKRKETKNLANLNTAFAASAFLRTYGSTLALDVATARSAITNKLMEIANCGMTQYELKALELLGKVQDIALFTNRSEVTINYKTPEDLENAIKERVKRLLNAEILDVTPIKETLDEELGVFKGLDEEGGDDDPED